MTGTRAAVLLTAWVLIFSSCATQSTGRDSDRVVHMEPMQIQRQPDPLTGLDTFDAGDLLKRGNELFDRRDFDHVVAR